MQLVARSISPGSYFLDIYYRATEIMGSLVMSRDVCLLRIRPLDKVKPRLRRNKYRMLKKDFNSNLWKNPYKACLTLAFHIKVLTKLFFLLAAFTGVDYCALPWVVATDRSIYLRFHTSTYHISISASFRAGYDRAEWLHLVILDLYYLTDKEESLRWPKET